MGVDERPVQLERDPGADVHPTMRVRPLKTT
jgi:hypothetical protein